MPDHSTLAPWGLLSGLFLTAQMNRFPLLLTQAFLSPPCRPVLTENMSQGVRTLSAPVQKHDAATAAIKAAAAAEHEERESRWLEKATHRLPYEEDDFGDGSQAPRQRKQKRRGGRGGGRGRGRGRGSRGGDDGDEDEEEEEEEAAAAGACVVVPQRAGGSFMTAHARLRLEAAARGEEPPPPQQQPAAPSGMPPYKAPGFTAASGFRDPSAPRQAGPAWTAGRPAQGGRAQGPAGRGGGSQGPPGMRRALQSMNNEDGGDGGDCGLSPAVLAKLCPNGEPVRRARARAAGTAARAARTLVASHLPAAIHPQQNCPVI